MTQYYKTNNGDMIAKWEVDSAIRTLEKLKDGFEIVNLSDEEVFTKGSKLDAIKRFREKYDTGLLEAKCAIEFLRGEEMY